MYYINDMDSDFYGEVINGAKTYKKIAMQLKKGKNVIIGWACEDTHYDILFSMKVDKYGILQRGLQKDYLYISIISFGSFGFKTVGIKDSSYIAEKLFNGRDDYATGQVTELINNVIKELNKVNCEVKYEYNPIS